MSGQREDMRLLQRVFAEPAMLKTASGRDWEEILYQGLVTALHGCLAELARAQGFDSLPGPVRDQLIGAEVIAGYNRRVLAWEVDRIGLALEGVKGPVVLLKGAAYQMRGLPSLKGRFASDVDILVPKEQIAEVEETLKRAGWRSIEKNAYDEQYYRQWMHEIPPMQNIERGTYIDVHHTILPETGRLTPDTAHLFGHAEPIEGTNLYTLSPADLTLHTIVHCFQDGDLMGRLRDVVDIAGLFADYGQVPGFWDSLFEASDVHGFGRPLYYALYFAKDLLNADIPDDVMARAEQHRPSVLTMRLMRFAVPRALMPVPLTGASGLTNLARNMTLARSHWLKMPPFMLVKHLSRKAFLGLVPRRD